MASHSSISGSSELAPTRATLLERLRDLQDHASWQQFFDTYWKLIYCAAIKSGLSDQEAEEVVQETIIGVARNMETFEYRPESCSFKGYLMHITRRRIIDRLRKHGKRPLFVPLTPGTDTSEPGMQLVDEAGEKAFTQVWNEEWEKNVIDAALERVKKAVKPDHYQIFYLYGVKKMPLKKVCELLNISAAKVYVVQHRVARMVKREVQTLAKL
jgi:RNA polymerase sigma-70 factor (ECF subfamily)